MGKVRHRKVKRLAPGLIGSKWQSQDSVLRHCTLHCPLLSCGGGCVQGAADGRRARVCIDGEHVLWAELAKWETQSSHLVGLNLRDMMHEACTAHNQCWTNSTCPAHSTHRID